MSETQHTPGPWKYDPGTLMVLNSDGQMTVADMRGWGALRSTHSIIEAVKIQDANGALIAESPNLLKGCRMALTIIADAIMHGMPITEEVAECRNLLITSIHNATQSSGEER